MDTDSLISVIGTFITFVVCITISYLVLKKKSNLKLNKYFAGFFLTFSLAFFAYSLYNIWYTSLFAIYFFYYIARLGYSIGTFFLLHTTFIFIHSEKMPKIYVYISRIYLFVSIIGYLFFPATIDMDELADTNVSIEINFIWDLFVIISVLAVFLFTLWTFASKLKNSQGLVKRKSKFFTLGMIFLIIAVIFIMFAIGVGIIHDLLKITGIFSMDVGVILFYVGISLKE